MEISIVNLSYLVSKEVNGYFEEINENKNFTLLPTTESKEKIKKNKELWIKTRDLIR